jgi:hypothetical protein
VARAWLVVEARTFIKIRKVNCKNGINNGPIGAILGPELGIKTQV